MTYRFHTLDVFTDTRFGGNPLAVVLDADDLSTEQMQTIAREFNLSETIFVKTPDDPAHTAKVRIFLPAGEIPFAGHPTVGCAILLAEAKYKAGCSFETSLTLEAKAGLVPVRVTRIGPVARAQFTAPVVPFRMPVAVPSDAELAAALSLPASAIGFDGHRPGAFQGGPSFLFVPVRTRADLTACRIAEPQWSSLVSRLTIPLVYAYTRGTAAGEADFHARAFAPTSGVPEDPATGSATAVLAAQLLGAENLGDGQHRWRLAQGYDMGRPSNLWLEADVAAGALVAVRVAGQAVPVMEGRLSL
jgi:trans-2,3-dihydro-3-hydroxyanthranilate isomerase